MVRYAYFSCLPTLLPVVVSSNLTATMKTLFKESEFPYVKNRKNTKMFWSPRNWNHVLVWHVDPYIRSVPGGGSVTRLSRDDWLTFHYQQPNGLNKQNALFSLLGAVELLRERIEKPHLTYSYLHHISTYIHHTYVRASLYYTLKYNIFSIFYIIHYLLFVFLTQALLITLLTAIHSLRLLLVPLVEKTNYFQVIITSTCCTPTQKYK